VVWKLDRLARSTRDLLETIETIREAGGRFRSISEPWADTTPHTGEMIMTIFAGIAEFERSFLPFEHLIHIGLWSNSSSHRICRKLYATQVYQYAI
jgi:hypothetical protein